MRNDHRREGGAGVSSSLFHLSNNWRDHINDACDHLVLAAGAKLLSRSELVNRIYFMYQLAKPNERPVWLDGSANFYKLVDESIARLVDDSCFFRCLVEDRHYDGDFVWRYHYNLAHLGHIRQRSLKEEMKTSRPAPSSRPNTELPCLTAPLPQGLPDSSSVYSGTVINPTVEQVERAANLAAHALKAAATTTASRRSSPAKRGAAKRSSSAARSASKTTSKSASRSSARPRPTR